MPDAPPAAAPATALIVLAAGKGTRMKSTLPKPLHPVAGVPMVQRVLRAGMGADPDVVAIVVSPETAGIVSALDTDIPVAPVMQDPPRGTGEAARLALEALPDAARAVVLFSDNPLLEAQHMRELVQRATETGALVTMLTANVQDAAHYGRIVRDAEGHPVAVVEKKDDDPALRTGQEVEINSGIMVLDAAWARRTLQALPPNPVSGEYYLTDLIAAAVAARSNDARWPVATVTAPITAALGVNDRVELAEAEELAWARNRERAMRAGVTMRLPETIIMDDDVEIGPDSVILPNTMLLGRTHIGSGAVIGPGAVITDSTLGNGVVVRNSTLTDVEVGDGSDVGPYAHLRGGARVAGGVHIGNFAEIKNSDLASGVKVGHFSYLGDARIGAETNVGAGTITANFDGVHKHRTEIGERVFLGSDTILRAPIRLGDDARTGAGSVVTKDVEPGATVVGVPARQIRRKPTAETHGEEG
ncbi:MAG: bifunctional UDP-N-acetylglucosamine diphosphorylase/glucosamine-1-phosphate N-acetyltransferase GlmU [Chloroflexota bacterium]|nr:bifunctional UDP-N-acetylglucosamine diphosphorylase/glucosamine-1-phosphate N-acetyltransferase GlmU [Chloroflexota bacterium]